MVPFQPPIQHVPPMSTLLPNPLWVPALFTPSTVGSSYPRLSDTCAAPAPTCLWTPPFAYGLPIFYYFYLFIYLFLIVIIFIITLWGLLPFAVELLPFSLLGSSPSHCGLLCPIGLLPPSAWGPFTSHSSEGLLPIFPWGSSPCYYGGCLPSWLLGSPPFLAGAPPLSLGLIPISFTQLWGFPTSLWGSSPFLRGASSRCGALPHLAPSTAGLPHISVGLFPISLTQQWGLPTSVWGSSPSFRGSSSRCGALPPLALLHISLWVSFPSLRGASFH